MVFYKGGTTECGGSAHVHVLSTSYLLRGDKVSLDLDVEPINVMMQQLCVERGYAAKPNKCSIIGSFDELVHSYRLKDRRTWSQEKDVFQTGAGDIPSCSFNHDPMHIV